MANNQANIDGDDGNVPNNENGEDEPFEFQMIDVPNNDANNNNNNNRNPNPNPVDHPFGPPNNNDNQNNNPNPNPNPNPNDNPIPNPNPNLNPIIIEDNNDNNNDQRQSRFSMKQKLVAALLVCACLISAIMYGIDDEYNPEMTQMLFKAGYEYLEFYDSLLKLREKSGEFENISKESETLIPIEHPSKEWLDNLHIGSLIDALDVESKWYFAYVIDTSDAIDDHKRNINTHKPKQGNKVKIHFHDWPNKFDEWMDKSSGKIAPRATQAIGGRNQGGLPGWPLLPIRDNNDKNIKSDLLYSKVLPVMASKGRTQDFDVKCNNVDIKKNGILFFLCKTWFDTGKTFNKYPIWLNGDYFLYYSGDNPYLNNDKNIDDNDNNYRGQWIISIKIGEKINYIGTLHWSSLLNSKKPIYLYLKEINGHFEISIKYNKFSQTLKPKSNRKILPSKILHAIPKIELNNGVSMPWISFGAAGIPHKDVETVFRNAIDVGFTMIDTGYHSTINPLYFNQEKYLSNILQEYGRKNIFISTKIPCNQQGYYSTIRNIKYQLERLNTDYIDLVLISKPYCCNYNNNCEGSWLDTWRAMEYLYERKRINVLGVSEFNLDLLDKLMNVFKRSHIPLSIVRGWRDPLHSDNEIAKYCQEHDILYQCFSCLGGKHLLKESILKNPLFKNPRINEIVINRNKNNKNKGNNVNLINAAQVIVKWNLQQGIAMIVKSTNKQHLLEIIDSISMPELTLEELNQINFIKYFDDEFDSIDDGVDNTQNIENEKIEEIVEIVTNENDKTNEIDEIEEIEQIDEMDGFDETELEVDEEYDTEYENDNPEQTSEHNEL